MTCSIWKVITVFLIVLSLGACSGSESQRAGLHEDSFQSRGLQRTILYYIPKHLKKQARPPLVLILHAFGESAKSTSDMSSHVAYSMADSAGAVVVYPNAIAAHWNDNMGTTYDPSDGVDDVAFLRELTDHFINRFNCDPRRVYVVGISNGGTMAYRLSLEMPEKIAGMAVFIATLGREELEAGRPMPPIPVMITLGTADPVFRWEGSNVGPEAKPIIIASSAQENLNYWLGRNNAVIGPDTARIPDYCTADNSTAVRYSWKGMKDVVFYKVTNGGHNLPFKRKYPLGVLQNCDYDSMTEAFRFLLRQSK